MLLHEPIRIGSRRAAFQRHPIGVVIFGFGIETGEPDSIALVQFRPTRTFGARTRDAEG